MANILVVEDDMFIREVAELMMQDWGHSTVAAGSVDEALTILRSNQTIDALFTDIYLKNAVLGGCELADQAVHMRPDLRVLYTTGNFVTDAMKALFVDGKHFLRKPYTPQQLHHSVNQMLAA